eukprot:1925580-Amphidinium_carterae.2
MRDAVYAKSKYSEKEVLDMFVMADPDRKGYLQRDEVCGQTPIDILRTPAWFCISMICTLNPHGGYSTASSNIYY